MVRGPVPRACHTSSRWPRKRPDFHNHRGPTRTDGDFGEKDTAWANLPLHALRGDEVPRISTSTELQPTEEATALRSANGNGCAATMKSPSMPILSAIQVGAEIQYSSVKSKNLFLVVLPCTKLVLKCFIDLVMLVVMSKKLLVRLM